MTSKRNLGPALAMAGAGIAIAAVIAGFILVGGPGDARERRLDEIAMNRITRVISTVQCAYNATGAIPTSLEDAGAARFTSTQPSDPPIPCDSSRGDASISTGEQPAAPGYVTYRAVDATHIRVCGNFRRPKSATDAQDAYRDSLWATYPQLNEARPAGVHCFDLEILKGADHTHFTVSHAGHMDVFE